MSNKSKEEVDDLIQKALSKEEAEFFDQLGEQNIPQQFIGLFKGKNSWMNILIAVIHVIALVVAIYTFTNMLDSEVIVDKMEWMFYTIVCFMAMVLLKIWGWNQMDKNSLMREIKRLEYQVSLMKKQD